MVKELKAGSREEALTKKAMQSVRVVIIIEKPAILRVLLSFKRVLILGFSWSETPTITNMSSTPTPEEGREEVRGFEFGGV